MRFTNFTMLEAAKTGSLVKLDDLIKRDKVSETDWLLPLSTGKVLDGYYGLQQDFRIPVLLYRKSLLQKAGVTPPKTWDEVCAAGGKLNKDNVVGYAVPLGSGGGIGGAQPLAENFFSSMISEDEREIFRRRRQEAVLVETGLRPVCADDQGSLRQVPGRSANQSAGRLHRSA